MRGSVSLGCRLVFAAGLILAVGACVTNVREPRPAGRDWTLAASGRSQRVIWRIYTTPATDDGVCSSIDIYPPPAHGFYVPLDESEVYKDRITGCLLLPGTTRQRHPAEIAGGVSDPEAPYAFIYGVIRGDVKEVRAMTKDDRIFPDIAADQGGNVFLVVMPPGTRVHRLLFVLDDGDKEKCSIRWAFDSVPILDEC